LSEANTFHKPPPGRRHKARISFGALIDNKFKILKVVV